MDIKQRITSFVILHAGWIVWLLVGLSTGGLMSVLQRAVTLLGTSRRVRRFATKYLIPSRGLFRLPSLSGAEAQNASPRFI
jgi:hypothetical protein